MKKKQQKTSKSNHLPDIHFWFLVRYKVRIKDRPVVEPTLYFCQFLVAPFLKSGVTCLLTPVSVFAWLLFPKTPEKFIVRKRGNGKGLRSYISFLPKSYNF